LLDGSKMGKIKGIEQPKFDGSKMTMSSTFGYNPQSSRRTAPTRRRPP
jgi:hypothetical protein